jgi:Holliday junction resolvase
MPVSAKGSRRERELLAFLAKQGFLVHRIAGSGKGEEAVCDLIAIKNGVAELIECKSRKKVYYPKNDLAQLQRLIVIAERAGVKPILAVKLNYKNWHFTDISKGIPAKVS